MSPQASDAKRIFLEAVEKHPSGQWPGFLDQACKGDSALRDHVEALLKAHGESNPMLDGTGVVATGSLLPITEAPGTMIGPYKLLEQIGEGGMGVVYMAEQREPVERRVALKIIKPGMDTRQVIGRFEAERQALAMMDHPNIARVFEAGTTEMGRLYFVMELVKGVPITQYCDEHRLTTQERLELFVPVCQAVQHAHQKGIIHRDIKPSNVMVAEYDGRPVPKIIDFGVAKAIQQRLTEKTMFTHYGQIVGTIGYMSPEQANLNQSDVDTRSDIYSLGVLLYELLAGETPFDRVRLRSAAFDELLRIIREEDPPKPSLRLSTSESLPSIAANRQVEPKKLGTLVSGELDWIVMKALEKDRTRRYETANGFARDVQRYLDDEPVEACPPSRAYRFRKFVRRNKAALVTASIVALALVLGLAGTSWQAIRATKAEMRALDQKQEADAAADREAEAAKRERGAARRERESARLATEAAGRERLARTEADEQGEKARENAAKAEAGELAARRQRDAAHRNLYLAHMQLARQDWNAGQTARLHEFLDAHIPQPGAPDLRGWEWYYFLAHCHRDLLTLRGHEHRIRSVAWSPDGRWIVSGGLDSQIKVWDPATGKEIVSMKEPRMINGLTWSPDSQQFASISDDGNIKIWEAATWVPIRTIAAHKAHKGEGNAIAWSPDGRRLVSATWESDVSDAIKIWDLATDQEVGSFEVGNDHCHSVAWSPDSRQIAASSNHMIRVWDVATKEKTLEMVRPGSGATNSIAWSPDGKRLVGASAYHGITVSDASSGEIVLSLDDHNGGVRSVAWRPDGKRLASAGNDQSVRIWEASTGQQIAAFHGHTDQVYSVAWSPDGQRIVSAGVDKTLKIWDATARLPDLPIKAHTGSVWSLAWSPDGRRLASSGPDGTVKIWDATTRKEHSTLFEGQGDVLEVAWSPDGEHLGFTWKDRVEVREAATGGKVFSLGDPIRTANAVTWSPDGRRIATYYVQFGTTDSTFRIWDAASGQEITTIPVDKSVNPRCLAWSPDGERLATGSWVWLTTWKVATGQKDDFPPRSQLTTILSVDWSPDGRQIATASEDHTIKVWDAASGKEVFMLRGHTGPVHCVVWSPEGGRLASVGTDGTLRIWDPETGQEVVTLRDHAGKLQSVAWSRDGKRIATGSDDGTIKIWDASTGYEVEVLQRAEATFARAHRLAEKGQHEEAIKLLEPLVAEFPDVPEHRKQLAKLYRRLGKSCRERDAFNQSIAAYTEAIRLDPELAVAREGRGNTYVESGEFGKAVIDYEKAVELDPNNASFRNSLAWWLATCLDEANRQPKRAVELAEEAVELDPNLATYHNTLGVAQYRAGQWEAAIECLEKSLQLQGDNSTDNSFDFFFLAMAHWQLDHKDEARQWFDKAVESMEEDQPDNEEIIRFRAEAAELLGVTEGSQPEEEPEGGQTQETTDRKSGTDGQESPEAAPAESPPPPSVTPGP